MQRGRVVGVRPGPLGGGAGGRAGRPAAHACSGGPAGRATQHAAGGHAVEAGEQHCTKFEADCTAQGDHRARLLGYANPVNDKVVLHSSETSYVPLISFYTAMLSGCNVIWLDASLACTYASCVYTCIGTDSCKTFIDFDPCPRSTAVPVPAVPSVEPGQPGGAEAAQPGGLAAGGTRAQGHGEHATVVLAGPNKSPQLLDWPSLERAAVDFVVHSSDSLLSHVCLQ
jgi:hypothetical protein